MRGFVATFLLVTCVCSDSKARGDRLSNSSLQIDDEVESFASSTEPSFANLMTSLGLGEGSRRQDRVPASQQFPCSGSSSNVASSAATPTSVHQLRPRDISVVASMGDSLVTGLGALAESLPQLFHKDQGVSWSIGGDGTWRSAVTLPNLLRQFNPRLVGFATSDKQERRHFSMGEPQSHDEHLLRQAQRLVAAMRSDPRVDIKRDWKLVTILTGHNDICSGKPCFPSEEAAGREHSENLRRALDVLHANLPRTFVSLLPVIDVTFGWQVEKSLVCGMLNMIECRCLYLLGDGNNLERMRKIVSAYHRAERDLVNSGRYDSREDFTVELQPFTSRVEPPRARNFLGFEMADLSLLSVDCFHLSQKGHAAFATMQWNNLLQPEYNKSTQFHHPLQNLACPAKSRPYLFTRKNSLNFKRTGHQ